MLENFEIKTEVFEGPLDLLLSLIEKRKLLINDIALAQITDDYLRYIKESNDSRGMSLEKNSHFILIASTLLLIKSKSLLPTLELTEEESQSIEDLEKRLKIYKRMKEVEPLIFDMYMSKPSFFKRSISHDEVIFSPSDQIKQNLMLESIKGVINTFPKVEKRAKAIVQKVMSLDEMIGRLTDRVKNSINMSFREFSNFDKKEKVNVVLSFLAMLQLVKEGIIEVSQNAHGDDIHMQTKEFGTPNYS
jgi:segregation and condensation protein A